MLTFRATNIEVLPLILTKLVPDPDISPIFFLAEIGTRMRVDPESVLILVHFVENELKGFLISYIPAYRDFLFIHQAWLDKNLSSKVSLEFKEFVIAFAKKEKLKAIRCETFRNSKGFIKKFGAKEHSKTLTFDLE